MKNDDVTKNVNKQTNEDKFATVVKNPTSIAERAPDKLKDLLSYPLFDV